MLSNHVLKPFSGGSLVPRHLGREVIFDWSSSFQGSHGQNIQWAAFFSDVEHEILPVTSGHRITLTYNLYYEEERSSSIPVVSPFYNYLATRIKNIKNVTRCRDSRSAKSIETR